MELDRKLKITSLSSGRIKIMHVCYSLDLAQVKRKMKLYKEKKGVEGKKLQKFDESD